MYISISSVTLDEMPNFSVITENLEIQKFHLLKRDQSMDATKSQLGKPIRFLWGFLKE